jgi:hypothetical protein
MGGVVARAMVTLPNYMPGALTHVITLSTPHTAPPANVEHALERVYAETNAFWRAAYGYASGHVGDDRVHGIPWRLGTQKGHRPSHLLVFSLCLSLSVSVSLCVCVCMCVCWGRGQSRPRWCAT